MSKANSSPHLPPTPRAVLNMHARQPQASDGEEGKDHNRKTARSEAKGIKKAEIIGEQSSKIEIRWDVGDWEGGDNERVTKESADRSTASPVIP